MLSRQEKCRRWQHLERRSHVLEYHQPGLPMPEGWTASLDDVQTYQLTDSTTTINQSVTPSPSLTAHQPPPRPIRPTQSNS